MISILFTLVTLLVAVKSCGDFYWRDYNGVVPSDAIPAGEDSRGVTYIGQGYIHEYALSIGTIIPGERMIDVACYGVKKALIVKILCARDKNKYYWLSTTNATYAQDTAEKCPVVGGYDQRQSSKPIGTLHVGRTRKHGDVILGGIGAYRVPDPWFYYPFENKEIRESEYEVLMYNDFPVIHPQSSNRLETKCLP